MMSLETAKEKWKLSTNTILSYVADGLIEGIVIDNNNMLLFPDIPKPKRIRKNLPKNSKNIYHWILVACQENEYITPKLMGIDENRFINHITALEKEGYISRINNHTNCSNLNYQISHMGTESLKRKTVLSAALFSITGLGISII